MKGSKGIFVKVNYKNMGELQSFIYDMTNGKKEGFDQYIMCVGKYDKNGWSIVFKARNVQEAEKIVSLNTERVNRVITPVMETISNQVINPIMIETDTVTIPSWL